MTYSTKKSAQSRARKDYGANYAELCNIVETEEGWVITLKDDEPQSPSENSEPQNTENTVAETSSDDCMSQFSDNDGDNEEDSELQKQSMFGTMIGLMTGDVAAPQAPVSSTTPPNRTGLKIEKERPEQNGVKRPSAGGLCRAVWDACWAYQEEHGTPPTAKDVKAIAEKNGWNPNNASIEYYQWRKYNGIQGRVSKPAAPTEQNAD